MGIITPHRAVVRIKEVSIQNLSEELRTVPDTSGLCAIVICPAEDALFVCSVLGVGRCFLFVYNFPLKGIK